MENSHCVICAMFSVRTAEHVSLAWTVSLYVLSSCWPICAVISQCLAVDSTLQHWGPSFQAPLPHQLWWCLYRVLFLWQNKWTVKEFPVWCIFLEDPKVTARSNYFCSSLPSSNWKKSSPSSSSSLSEKETTLDLVLVLCLAGWNSSSESITPSQDGIWRLRSRSGVRFPRPLPRPETVWFNLLGLKTKGSSLT